MTYLTEAQAYSRLQGDGLSRGLSSPLQDDRPELASVLFSLLQSTEGTNGARIRTCPTSAFDFSVPYAVRLSDLPVLPDRRGHGRGGGCPVTDEPRQRSSCRLR